MKKILITGGSSGFGRLAIPELLARGHDVIAGIRGGESRLTEVLGAELARYPDRLHAVDLHLDQPATLTRARDAVDRHFHGELDALVNNAGYGLFGTLEDTAASELREQFEVNFFSPVLLARELLPALIKARGRVINVTSIVGRTTMPGYGMYSATKFALEAHTEALRYELDALGIQVGLLEPGAFRTGFAKQGRRVSAATADPASRSAFQTRRLLELIDKSEARLADPRAVSRRIVSLVERPHLPPRTVVGLDARFVLLLSWLVPDRIRVASIQWIWRRIRGARLS